MDLSGARLDQVEDEDVGHVVDRSGGVAQVVEQVHDPLHVADGQRDEYHVRAVFLHVMGKVAQAADEFRVGFHAEPIAAPIVAATPPPRRSRRHLHPHRSLAGSHPGWCSATKRSSSTWCAG